MSFIVDNDSMEYMGTLTVSTTLDDWKRRLYDLNAIGGGFTVT